MMFLPSLLVLVPSTATAFIARQHTVPTTLPRTGRNLNAATPKFSPTKSCLFQTGNDNNGEEEEIFFDDFDFVIGGSGSNDYNANIPDTSLQERIQASQQEELKRETKLLQNWKTGDWSVRGFSLDPADALSEEQSSFQPQDGSQPQETNSPIYVSKVVPDINSQGTRIWVGRSNGSLVWVQLGQEYLAHFQSKITGTFIDDADNTGTNDDEDAPSSASARFQSKLVRESSQSPSTPNDDRPVTTPAAPFQVLAQCSANQGESAISNILPVPEEDLIFITCRGNGQIQQWHISEEDAESDTQALSSPVPLSEGIHNDEIVALKLIYYQNAPLLFSVSCDGSLAIWDAQNGDLVYHCKVNVDDIGNPEGDQGNDTVTQVIHCADVNEDQIFLGTTTGFVLGYLVSDLLNSASSGGACPLPRGKFKADDGGVTAIACGGPGSLGRGQDTSSVVLITGGANGLVKQW